MNMIMHIFLCYSSLSIAFFFFKDKFRYFEFISDFPPFFFSNFRNLEHSNRILLEYIVSCINTALSTEI